MSGHYQKHGLSIQYPENWSCSDSGEDLELPFEIAFESPDGALIAITLCDHETPVVEILRDYVDGLRAQYEDIEINSASSTLSGQEGVGVDANFYCLDFLVTAQVRIFAAPSWWIGVLNQAETRDFDRHKLVFDAIVTSLLRHQFTA